jgi:hypothetical protein
MTNEDDEFLRIAIQCGGADLSENADGSLTLFPDEIIALCKKVQNKQKEKDKAIVNSMFLETIDATVLDESDDYVYIGDVSEAICKGE